MKVGLIANDFQFPYHDRRAVGLFLTFARRLQPTDLMLAGDLLSCDSVSKFVNPDRDRRSDALLHETDLTNRFLDLLGAATPKSKTVIEEGNHEYRLRKFITTNAPALEGCLSIPALLRLADRKIDWVPYGESVNWGKLLVTHGDIVRKESAASAKAMLDKYGQPVIFGHTHRGGVYYRTVAGKPVAAWENFCLCSFRQPYTVGPVNWQHGWSVVYYNDRQFSVVQIPIINSTYLWEGKVYGYGKEERTATKRLPSATFRHR